MSQVAYLPAGKREQTKVQYRQAILVTGQGEGEIAVFGPVERQVFCGKNMLDDIERVVRQDDAVVGLRGVHHDPL